MNSLKLYSELVQWILPASSLPIKGIIVLIIVAVSIFAGLSQAQTIIFLIKNHCTFRVMSASSWICFSDDSEVYNWSLGNIETLKNVVHEARSGTQIKNSKNFIISLTDDPNMHFTQGDARSPDFVYSGYSYFIDHPHQVTGQIYLNPNYSDSPIEGITINLIVSGELSKMMIEANTPESKKNDPDVSSIAKENVLRYLGNVEDTALPIQVIKQ